MHSVFENKGLLEKTFGSKCVLTGIFLGDKRFTRNSIETEIKFCTLKVLE
jgi:hypothetical protein